MKKYAIAISAAVTLFLMCAGMFILYGPLAKKVDLWVIDNVKDDHITFIDLIPERENGEEKWFWTYEYRSDEFGSVVERHRLFGFICGREVFSIHRSISFMANGDHHEGAYGGSYRPVDEFSDPAIDDFTPKDIYNLACFRNPKRIISRFGSHVPGRMEALSLQ